MIWSLVLFYVFFYHENDEFLVVASERPVIQTVFNVSLKSIKELEPGHAILTKKSGAVSIEKIQEPLTKKQCSFERIYFSRGSDASIYKERKKLGNNLFPQIMKSINNDIENTVFSFIPNTAETSFYGLIESVQNYIVDLLNKKIKKGQIKKNDDIDKLLSLRPRVEKIAIKDAKLRTFITEDTQREDLVGHVYDVTYGVIKPKDNLVIIDDSIVRGTTLQKSILKILDRLNPKKIIIVSSAPQIRYIDCYGIDMARLDKLIAFRAALSLHKDIGTYDKILKETYKNCKASIENATEKSSNFVKAIYEPFSSEEISKKIADLLKNNSVKSDLEIIYQSIEGLHSACPDHLGDWYFSGNYPTPGGNKVVNKSFINFYEGKSIRAY